MYETLSVIDAHCDLLFALKKAADTAGAADAAGAADTAGAAYAARPAADAGEKGGQGQSGQGGRDPLSRGRTGHMDLPRMLEGGVRGQFMALFADEADLPRAREYTHGLIDDFEALCARSGGALFPLRTPADLARARKGESLAALLSLEGAEALEGSLDAVDEFYARGVRAIGITWSRRNPFGRGVKTEGEDGLSALGCRLVEKMEEKRMIVDCSHLCDEAFADLARVARRPFIASHSNTRSLCDHPRNLSDAQIRRIAEGGGAVGATFVPPFVALEPEKPLLQHFIDHVDRIVRIGGIECAALGSDFEGYRQNGEDSVIADASQYPVIDKALAERGYTPREREKILSKNWERVIRDIL